MTNPKATRGERFSYDISVRVFVTEIIFVELQPAAVLYLGDYGCDCACALTALCRSTTAAAAAMVGVFIFGGLGYTSTAVARQAQESPWCGAAAARALSASTQQRLGT